MPSRNVSNSTSKETFLSRNRRSPSTRIEMRICAVVLLLVITGLLAYALEELIYKFVGEEITEHFNSNNSSEISCKKRVIAYYGLWSSEEITMAQFSKLTHVIFNPMIVTSDGLISFRDTEDERKFEEMNGLAKKFKVKTMFSIGLAEILVRDIDTYMFSYFATDTDRRAKLINSILSFLHKHQLDGVEFNWLGPISKQNSTILPVLCQEVRKEMKSFAKVIGRDTPFLLSVQCPTRETDIDYGKVLEFVDFISVETVGYNYWSTSADFTIAGSPLYTGPGNVDKTMKKLICGTGKPNQLNIMVGFDGFYWKNVTTSANGKWLNPTEENGIINGDVVVWKYMKENGWNVSSYSWNDESKLPYIWKQPERSYLAFENDRSLREKVKYIADHNIGGIAINWIVNDDAESTLLSAAASEATCPKNVLEYNCTN